jgi:3-dehydroquinate dehydratase-1
MKRKPLDFASSHPLLVGTVLTPVGLKKLMAPASTVDLAEVRVDALLAAKVPLETISAALKQRRVPVLLTCRMQAEGGLYRWKAGERADALWTLLPHADAVDVELASRRELKTEIALARRLGKKVILSAHAIEKPVPAATLKKWASALHKEKPDVAKIAARIGTRADLRALATLLLNGSSQRWAVMGLGVHGASSRQVFAALGSALLYGYLDKPAAPGQPSAASLRPFRDAFAK